MSRPVVEARFRRWAEVDGLDGSVFDVAARDQGASRCCRPCERDEERDHGHDERGRGSAWTRQAMFHVVHLRCSGFGRVVTAETRTGWRLERARVRALAWPR